MRTSIGGEGICPVDIRGKNVPAEALRQEFERNSKEVGIARAEGVGWESSRRKAGRPQVLSLSVRGGQSEE